MQGGGARAVRAFWRRLRNQLAARDDDEHGAASGTGVSAGRRRRAPKYSEWTRTTHSVVGTVEAERAGRRRAKVTSVPRAQGAAARQSHSTSPTAALSDVDARSLMSPLHKERVA